MFHKMLAFLEVAVSFWRLELLTGRTNNANYTAAGLPWKPIQLHVEENESRHSPQRPVKLPKTFFIFFNSPLLPLKKRHARSLVETDSVGFMLFWGFCLSYRSPKSQVLNQTLPSLPKHLEPVHHTLLNQAACQTS